MYALPGASGYAWQSWESRNEQREGRVMEKAEADPTYPPSWVDRLFEWVQRLPFPGWLFYLGIWVVQVLLFNGLTWVEGTQVPLRFDIYLIIWGWYQGFYLGYMHYLDGVASQAFVKFRPVLALSDADCERLRYTLTTMPARNVWIAGILGALITLLDLPYDPPALIGQNVSSVFSAPLGIFSALTTNYLIGVFVYHSIRQLHIVRNIHENLTRINLFHLDPLYAFSVLTARTGIGYVLAMMLGVTPLGITVTPQGGFTLYPAFYIINILFIPLAIAVFLLPLLSIHKRLVQEKENRLAEANGYLEQVVAELHRRVGAKKLNDMDQLHETVSSLMMELDYLAKIRTWPWRAGTLTGFLSAISLPIIIFLIQEWLARYVFLP
jgi:hypothetical protein